MKVKFKPSFIKQYKKLPKALQEEAKEKIELIKENINHPFLKTHKLKGKLKSFWSCSVNYKDRIIFIYLDKKTISLVNIGDHSLYQ